MSVANSEMKVLSFVLKHTNTSSTTIGILPKNARLKNKPVVHVVEAFDAGSTDLLDIGIDSDADYFAADVDISSQGDATVNLNSYTLGDAVSDATRVKINYTPSGTAPTAGEAHIFIEYMLSSTA